MLATLYVVASLAAIPPPRPERTATEGHRVETLPKPLHRFGIELFGSDAELQKILDNVVTNVSVAFNLGGSMTVRHMLYDRKWMAGTGDAFVKYPGCPSNGCQAELQKPGALFFEIGANIGMGTVFASLAYPNLRTVAVEASPTNAFLLKWNLFSNGFTDEAQHIVIRGAMGTERGTLTFADCGNSWFSGARGSGPSSQRKKSKAGSEKAAWRGSKADKGDDCIERTVPMVTMPELMREHSVQRITVLRQDCEGCEFTTVPEWSRTGLAASIGWWTGEFHHLAKNESDATEAERILCGMLRQHPCPPERRITSWGPGLLTCKDVFKPSYARCPGGAAEADADRARYSKSSSRRGFEEAKHMKRPDKKSPKKSEKHAEKS